MNKKEMGGPIPRRISRRSTSNFEHTSTENKMLGGVTGLRVPVGNIYMILHHQVGGVSKIETTKYGHETRGTQTRAGLRWRGPEKTENYRTDLSTERATHINNS
jgi:hypothetical protein